MNPPVDIAALMCVEFSIFANGLRPGPVIQPMPVEERRDVPLRLNISSLISSPSYEIIEQTLRRKKL
jgi:hypothetical protein